MSYVLRGCILAELAMRKRIAPFKEIGGKHHRRPFADRLIEVVDPSNTGEVLLDEALRIIKLEPKKYSVTQWIDLLSGN